MTSVTFTEAVGGDGFEVDDTAGPNGLKGGGHRTRFVKSLEQTVAVADHVNTKAEEANNAASSALNAPGTAATSITPIAVPTINPTDVAFTLAETGKLFTKGQTLIFASDADPEVFFLGVLMAFVSATGIGTLKARQFSGAGTHSDWKVSLSSPIDTTLGGRVSALEANQAAEAEDRLFYYGDFF